MKLKKYNQTRQLIRVLTISCGVLIGVLLITWGLLLAAGYLTDSQASRTATYEKQKMHCSKPNVVYDRGGLVFPLDYGLMTKPTDSNYDEMVRLALRPHTHYAFSCSSEGLTP